MAKFKNVHKRRPRETEKQKQERNFWEAGMILKARVERALAKYGAGSQIAVSVARILPVNSAPNGGVQLVGPAPKAEGPYTDGELLLRFLGRLAFRLRRWFRGFWSAARFTHPAGWLLEGQNRTKL